MNLRLLAGIQFLLVFVVASAASAFGHTAGEGAEPSSPLQTTSIALTLDEVIRRAEANEPAYAASLASSKMAVLDRSIARAALLPSIDYHNQALYTQANGLTNQGGQGVLAQPSPRFIANNAVREYSSQAVINETLSLGQVAEVRRADAAAALAAAEQEVARRGLVVAVTGLFYSALAADHKLDVAQRAHKEAADFTLLTQEREQGREAAHADVLKAQLVEQQRGRDLEDARVAAQKARLELGVLLFADPRTAYTLQAGSRAALLPARAEVEAAAAHYNPELKGALAALDASNADVLAARAAYLPSLGLNVTYGVDAPQLAVNGPEHARNLGYSASVTLDIPVWDWLATQHKVKQSEIRRTAARVALSAAQRQLIAQLDESYSEAAAARDALTSLDESVTAAAESLRLTKLRYKGGEATVLEVVDAESTFVGVENAREDGQVRYEMARAGLETLAGKI
jgi:outer membrane protein TolC